MQIKFGGEQFIVCAELQGSRLGTTFLKMESDWLHPYLLWYCGGYIAVLMGFCSSLKDYNWLETIYSTAHEQRRVHVY